MAMKNLKILSIAMIGILILGLTLHKVIASTQYTPEEIATHDTSTSCWVIYDNAVYDITTYLPIHNQRYSDISSWCGTDITQPFDSERKHLTTTTKNLLETFRVGTLSTATVTPTTTTDNTTSDSTQITETTTITKNNPYNLLVPVLIATILYWGHYIFAFKINKPPRVKFFNAFWNTMLLLSFIIPTLGFGVIMILQYQFPTLANSSFDFLYWHVELSLFMGIVGLFHFIKRIKIYWAQIRKNA